MPTTSTLLKLPARFGIGGIRLRPHHPHHFNSDSVDAALAISSIDGTSWDGELRVCQISRLAIVDTVSLPLSAGAASLAWLDTLRLVVGLDNGGAVIVSAPVRSDGRLAVLAILASLPAHDDCVSCVSSMVPSGLLVATAAYDGRCVFVINTWRAGGV